MYSSVSLMKRLYPMVNSITTVSSADLVLFIEQAGGIVDSYVGKQYTVPLSPTPPLIETLTTDLVMYRLLALRFFTQKQMNESVWPTRFKETSAMLVKLAEGEITLTSSDGTALDAVQGEASFQSNTVGYNQTMTEDDEILSWPDPNKIDSIRSSRS